MTEANEGSHVIDNNNNNNNKRRGGILTDILPVCHGEHGRHGIKCDGCPFAMECIDKAKTRRFAIKTKLS